MRPIRLLALASLTAALLGGCNAYSPGGSGKTNDVFTYESTAAMPATVVLKDMRSGETLWTNEVPVGKRLVVRFHSNRYKENPAMPDMMRWGVLKSGQKYGELDSEMAVPDQYSRRLDLIDREAGELPPGGRAIARPIAAAPAAAPAAPATVAPATVGPRSAPATPATPAGEPATKPIDPNAPIIPKPVMPESSPR
jgi:hypothetical protein